MRHARVLPFVLGSALVVACGGESVDAGRSAPPPAVTADASCACTATDPVCGQWLADHCLDTLGCPPTLGQALRAENWETKTLYVACTDGSSAFEPLEVGRGFTLLFDKHGVLFYASKEPTHAVCGSPISIEATYVPKGASCYRCEILPAGTEADAADELAPCLVDESGRLEPPLT